MGAHFAPPFAIITMHKIETAALSNLQRTFGFAPIIFKRYIDDIIIGPLSRTDQINEILEMFNNVDQSFQFTAEIPQAGQPLNFLDLSIYFRNGEVCYTWYTKPCHSDNTLSKDSWVPNAIKDNFLASSVHNVSNRCSNDDLQQVSLDKLKIRLHKNGFNNRDWDHATRPRKQNKPQNQTPPEAFLKLDFLSDSHNRQVRNLIKKYNFNIQLRA